MILSFKIHISSNVVFGSSKTSLGYGVCPVPTDLGPASWPCSGAAGAPPAGQGRQALWTGAGQTTLSGPPGPAGDVSLAPG